MHRFRKATNIRRSRRFIFACLVILFASACQTPASLPAVLPATQIPLPPTKAPPTLPATHASLPADPAAIVLGQPFTLELGQERVLPEVDLHLRFDHVLEDSRCPRQVVCVWSGQVRVVISVWSGADTPTLLEFSTLARPPVTTNVQIVNGLSIYLQAVAPFPVSPATPIPQKDYRLTLQVK